MLYYLDSCQTCIVVLVSLLLLQLESLHLLEVVLLVFPKLLFLFFDLLHLLPRPLPLGVRLE